MTDCLVIGGGLIGMLTARELRLAGATVRLVERGATGQESSWAGGGILSPLYPWRYPHPVTALARWSQQAYPGFSGELANETGIDPEWTKNGLLVLDSAEKAIAQAWAGDLGARLDLLGTKAILQCEPGLGRSRASMRPRRAWMHKCRQRHDCMDAGGSATQGAVAEDAGSDRHSSIPVHRPPPHEALWMPDVAQIRNPRLLNALKVNLPTMGVAVEEHTEITGFVVRHDRVEGVETSRGRITAGSVVVAAGAWSGRLLAGLGYSLDVAPVRGQMILFRARPGVVSRIVLNQGRYLVPRCDGRVLAGSTLEYVGFDKTTTEEALAELSRAAIAMVPALADYEIERHWAGLRPGSPCGVPYIGEHPRVQGLFINAGHFRNGVVIGPASARLLADILLRRKPALDPAPYALEDRESIGA